MRAVLALTCVIAVVAVVVLAAPERSGSQAGPDVDPEEGSLVERGRTLYASGCQSCHGPRGEGVSGTGPPSGAERVQGAGPSLVGVGAASVDFYLSTGYMPLDDPDDRPERKEPEYTPAEIDAIVAFIESLGPDGPPLPEVHPERGDLAEGFAAFTASCAGCHQVVGEGGVVLDGIAPELERATPTQIAEAVRIGPYLMPRFGEKELDQHTLDSIARYIEYTSEAEDPGGWEIGHIGPIPEGLVAWVAAGIVLVGVARLIGKRIA